MPETAAARLLTRHARHRRGGPPVRFLGHLALESARVHELCGASRRVLALTVAKALSGPVLWIKPDWVPGRLNPDGMHRFVDPARLLFARPKRPEDVLWCAEEALRAGVVPLVVADLPALPGLTAVRRLHLAAENGAEAGEVAPLGLLLTPGAGGARGVESRWALSPLHGENDREEWRLERLRARTAPEGSWRIEGARAGLGIKAERTVTNT